MTSAEPRASPSSTLGVTAEGAVPVDATPGYAELVPQPMDLTTVQRKLDHGEYLTLNALSADLRLIPANCLRFNARVGELDPPPSTHRQTNGDADEQREWDRRERVREAGEVRLDTQRENGAHRYGGRERRRDP